jgi:hypothetical protein
MSNFARGLAVRLVLFGRWMGHYYTKGMEKEKDLPHGKSFLKLN